MQSHSSTLVNTTYVSIVIVYESRIFSRSPLGRCTFWELERDREKRAKKGGHCASYVRKVLKAPPPPPNEIGVPRAASHLARAPPLHSIRINMHSICRGKNHVREFRLADGWGEGC